MLSQYRDLQRRLRPVDTEDIVILCSKYIVIVSYIKLTYKNNFKNCEFKKGSRDQLLLLWQLRKQYKDHTLASIGYAIFFYYHSQLGTSKIYRSVDSSRKTEGKHKKSQSKDKILLILLVIVAMVVGNHIDQPMLAIYS